MVDGRVVRPGIAGGGHHIDARVGGAQEGQADRVVQAAAALAGQVEHVHSVNHRLFDGGGNVRIYGADGGPAIAQVRPEHLVRGRAGARRHARYGADIFTEASRGRHAAVAAGGGRHMRAMAATAISRRVARRRQVAPMAAYACREKSLVERACADQFVVAVAGLEAFARLARALPAGGGRAVGELVGRVEAGVALRIDAVGKGGVFR